MHPPKKSGLVEAVQKPREIFAAELDEMEQRRKVAGLLPLERSASSGGPGAEGTEQKVRWSTNLAGISLSGGGLRSACFCLGVVQALCKKNLWRSFDYLSTVSGGGYLGSHLSAFLVKLGRPVKEGELPIEEPGSEKQPLVVRKLIHGGKYLQKPWTWANFYFVGLVLLDLAVLSGIFCACALIAWLWRCLDLQPTRDFLALLDLHNDLAVPFLPFVLCLVVWILIWLVSYFRRGTETSSWLSRHFLYPTVASFFIGSAILIGNGDIGIGYRTMNPDESSIPVSENLVVFLSLVLTTLLTPFLQPKRLFESGRSRKGSFKHWVFTLAGIALLVGIPLAAIAVLGRENVSDYATARDPDILPADIKDWPAYFSLIGDLNPEPEPEPDLQAWLTDELVYRASQQFNEMRKKQDRYFGKPSWGAWNGWKNWHRYFEFLTRPFSRASAPNLDGYWEARKAFAPLQEDLCKEFNASFLKRDRLYQDMVFAGNRPEKLDSAQAAPRRKQVDEFLVKLKEARPGFREFALLKERWLLASSFGTGAWPEHQVKQLNRLLLEAHFPAIFEERTTIYRKTLIVEDQRARLSYFLVSLIVFLIAGCLVNVNTTSMHRFYRERLTVAFLGDVIKDPRGPKLSDLNMTSYGGAYHLINASVTFFGRDWEQSRPWENPSKDLFPPGPCVDTFLFSRHYCGSDLLGYRPTLEYETHFKDGFHLSDAMAISSAAVHPGQVNNWLLAFLMVVLNFRLGQWLPNPRWGKPRLRPKLLPTLWSLLRRPQRRPYCYVADGGQSENLGLLPLLERRCKFIVAVDATRDLKHEFDDFSESVRRARFQEGIRIVELRTNRELQIAQLQPSPPTNLCVQHFLIARIEYPRIPEGPEVEEGLLIYLKPSFTGDESVDLKQYRAAHSEFPHESTADQLFDESQVESYRHLGYHIGVEAVSVIDAELRRINVLPPPPRDESPTAD